MNTQPNPYALILQQYHNYDSTNTAKDNLPQFTYMEQDSPSLIELREQLQINERIGNLSEIEAILDLLKWVYDTIPYDGCAPNPEKHDAYTILNNPQPVNCRIKAIVLNEVYLSAGFKSRILFCLPADPDGDIHVITLVYITSLGKWISVDPSHNTYFMSDKGLILNAIEARQMYAEGNTPNIKHIDREVTASLFCGGIPCASYDEFYLIYMSKNCFRLKCPVKSELRYDSHPDDIEYVILNPLDYDPERGYSYDNIVAEPSKRFYTHSIGYFLEEPGK